MYWRLLVSSYLNNRIHIYRDFVTASRSRILPVSAIEVCMEAAQGINDIAGAILRDESRIESTFFWLPYQVSVQLNLAFEYHLASVLICLTRPSSAMSAQSLHCCSFNTLPLQQRFHQT